VSRIELAPGVDEDFERILAHWMEYSGDDAPMRIRDIIEAISILEHSPLLGRPIANGTRELVIGRDSRGYVALFRYLPELDTSFVLAVKSQREAGYGRV